MGSVQCLSFTPDSHWLIARTALNEIITLEVPTGTRTRAFEVEGPQVAQGAPLAPLLSLSPDGATLALSSASGLGVDLWEFKTGKLLYSLPEKAGTVYWLAWSSDSRRLAVTRDNGTIDAWNLERVAGILSAMGLSP